MRWKSGAKEKKSLQFCGSSLTSEPFLSIAHLPALCPGAALGSGHVCNSSFEYPSRWLVLTLGSCVGSLTLPLSIYYWTRQVFLPPLIMTGIWDLLGGWYQDDQCIRYFQKDHEMCDDFVYVCV